MPPDRLLSSLQEKLKSVDVKIGTRKYGVLTSDAFNESLQKTSIKEFSGIPEHGKTRKYDGHNLEQAVNSKMKLNSKSFRDFGYESKPTPYSDNPAAKFASPQEASRRDASGLGSNRVKLLDKFGGSLGRSGSKTNLPAAQPTMMQRYGKPAFASAQRKTKKPNLVIKNGKLLISGAKRPR